MSHLQWQVGRRIGTPSNKIRTRKPWQYGKVSDAAATPQWFTFDIPRDSLIHGILITIGEDTTSTTTTRGTLADDITDIEVVINGYLQVKRMRGGMNKALHIMNRGNALSTGFYRLDFTDPRIPESRPLPAFIKEITSIELRIQDNTPAGSNYHHIIPTLLEEDCPDERRAEARGYPILCEAYPMRKDWSTNTGWVDPYEHDRNQKVYGYLYELLDGTTEEDPATDGFDLFKVEGRSSSGVDWIVEEAYLLDQKEINEQQYRAALPTGYVAMDFPIPLNTQQYSKVYSRIHIHTAAGTAARMRVLERYLLS